MREIDNMDKNTSSTSSASLITIIVILVLIVLVLSLSIGFLLAQKAVSANPTQIQEQATVEIAATSTLPQAFTATPKLEATGTATTTDIPSSTSQPGLPRSYTATPVSSELVITNEEATLQAQNDIPSEVLMDPAIEFTTEHIRITGKATIPLSNSIGRVEIIGIPEIVDGRLTMNILSATVDSEELPGLLVVQIEGYINAIFSSFLRGLYLRSFELMEGNMKLYAEEQK